MPHVAYWRIIGEGLNHCKDVSAPGKSILTLAQSQFEMPITFVCWFSVTHVS